MVDLYKIFCISMLTEISFINNDILLARCAYCNFSYSEENNSKLYEILRKTSQLSNISHLLIASDLNVPCIN